MIFYYALGGGLGHITRAQAVIHTLGIKGPVTLAYSPSSEACHVPLAPSFQPLPVPLHCNGNADALRAWLLSQLSRYSFHTMIIDAFPGGLLGELCDFPFLPETKLIHTARLLQWPRYQATLKGALPHYDTIYQLEQLKPDHRAALEACSDQLLPMDLQYPPAVLTDFILPKADAPLWLVVHAGSDEEIRELLALARETAILEGKTPQIVLLSPQRPSQLDDSIVHCNPYPAWPWFEQAERVFSGCGFNTTQQLKPMRDKHVFIPFARKFDDQFERSSRLR